MVDSVELVGTGLEGIPEQLETVSLQIELTDGQLQTESNNLGQASAELAGINTQVAGVSPLINTYLDLLTQSRGQLNKAVPAVIQPGQRLIVGEVAAEQQVMLYFGLVAGGGETAVSPAMNITIAQRTSTGANLIAGVAVAIVRLLFVQICINDRRGSYF